MLIVQVHIHVKRPFIEKFKEACIENARNSIQEAGIARFDVLQSQYEPERFVLTEIYRTPEAAAVHKNTMHYKIWRDRVEEMMAEPRYSIKFNNIYPDDTGNW